MKHTHLPLAFLLLAAAASRAQRPERGRDLGIPFEGTTGPLNAITDVGGVEVGHRTLMAGSGKLVVGKGPVRTGVTAVFPRGKDSDDPVFAGWFTMNGNGEMTGTTWVEESGFLWGPVMITNTHSVGVVRDAVIEWVVRRGRMLHDEWSLPVVAETWDGGLNDINGFHVTKQDAWAAMDSARAGPVVEGSVGGGTGMVCNQFKEGSERPRGGSTRRMADTPWACWCSVTTGDDAPCASPARRSARRLRTSCRAALPAAAHAREWPRPSRPTWARSSSWSPPTLRSCLTS